MKLPTVANKKVAALIFLFLIIYFPIGLVTFLSLRANANVKRLELNYAEVKNLQQNFNDNLSDELFNEHLELQEKQSLENKLTNLETQLEDVKESQEGELYFNLTAAYDLYSDFEAKLARNSNAKLDTEEFLSKVEEWGDKLIKQEFETLEEEITQANKSLDEKYQEYLATLPPPPPAASTGYSYVNVSTEKGSHGVYLIKLPLSSVRVKTVAASGSDCSDSCPTKSLEQFVKDNSGFAGINGGYFCPPDYPACSGKVNSFDFAFYHSSGGKWLNKGALSWDKTGLITFSGGSASFYKKSNEYGGGGVDAGVSNYPSLLKNGEVIVKDGELTSFQKVKGTRGAIGFGGENIYLAIITSATVEEAAYAMRSLGAQHALNLDGGGSGAMYIDGRYVVGPGRSLPTAIVLTR